MTRPAVSASASPGTVLDSVVEVEHRQRAPEGGERLVRGAHDRDGQIEAEPRGAGDEEGRIGADGEGPEPARLARQPSHRGQLRADAARLAKGQEDGLLGRAR